MKLKNVFTINAIFAWGFGLSFILFPFFTTSLFGLDFNESNVFAVRLAGAAFLGLGTVRFLVRNERNSDFRRRIVTGSIIQDTAGLLITLHAQLTGVLNQLGWIPVGIYWYFCFVYWYYFLANPDDPFLD